MDASNYIVVQVLMIFIFVFGYSSFMKMKDVDAFRSALGEIRLIPSFLKNMLPYFVIASEIFISLISILSIFVLTNLRLVSLICVFVLLIIFTSFIILTLRFKLLRACFCFGDESNYTTRYDLIRNIGLLCTSFVGIVSYSAILSDKFIGLTEALVVTMLAICIFLIVKETKIIARSVQL